MDKDCYERTLNSERAAGQRREDGMKVCSLECRCNICRFHRSNIREDAKRIDWAELMGTNDCILTVRSREREAVYNEAAGR